MNQRSFFQTVLGAGEGYAVLTNDLTKVGEFFEYPQELDKMVKYAEDHALEQVYYSPNLFTDKKRDKVSAKTVTVACADSDLMDPKGYRIAPSLTVETAAGRTHNYWLLDGDYDPHRVALLNRRMHHAHQGEGLDSSFAHAAKMLRVPGSINTKRGNAPVSVRDYSGTIYTLEELENAYPDDGTPDKVYGTSQPMPDDLPDRTVLLSRVTDNKYIRNLLFDAPIPGKRSDMRWKLEGELFRMGFSAEEVLVLVWDAPCCKFKQENRPMQQLWEEILNAEVDPRNQPSARVEYDPADGAPLIPLMQDIEPANFLSDAERTSLPLTFVDTYESWAVTKTTSPKKYHRSSALMIMSVVYAEFGHVPFEFEATKLNIWIMPLGNTTVDRKTTALRYMTGILESLETPDYSYDIGSDATKQGLNKLLGDRPNQSSLLHADEVQEVFREVFSQGYMTGLVGYWTELYSGRSRGVVRSTGEKQVIKSVPVNFMLYMTGIMSHVTEELTVKHFESGFLTRFIYVLVEPRPYNPSADLLKQSPATTAAYTDPVRESLVTHLAVNRNYWSMKGSRENTVPIRFSEDALKRLNEFNIKVKTGIQKEDKFETLKAPIERLVISVAKVSALFAMDERKSVIELGHVLAAIDLAEEWYDDLLKITAMVSEDGWQRDLNKLEQFIASKGGKVSYELAYKQFLDKRPQEFKEMVDGLEDMGRIRKDMIGRVTLEIIYATNTE
jgi:hypothetical protein